MIVPMKKTSLVATSRMQREMIDHLRNLGVLHITSRAHFESTALDAALAQRQSAVKALEILARTDVAHRAVKPLSFIGVFKNEGGF